MILDPLFPIGLPNPTELTARFTAIMWGLLRVIRYRGPRDPASLAVMDVLWRRLCRTITRFERLVIRVRAAVAAGTLPAPRRRASRSVLPRHDSPPDPSCPDLSHSGASPRPPRLPSLPGRHAWLGRMMGEYGYLAYGVGAQIEHLLTDPEMPALLAASPQLARLLRPLCRMLGVQPLPEALRSPPRCPRPRPPAATERPIKPNESSAWRPDATPRRRRLKNAGAPRADPLP